jgi:hypothetical protein
MTLDDLPLFSGARPAREGEPSPFGGEHDPDEVPRLATQLQAVWDLMADGRWRRLTEIAAAAKCDTQSAGARCRDLRKPKFGGHTVEKRRVPGTAVREYRLIPRGDQ